MPQTDSPLLFGARAARTRAVCGALVLLGAFGFVFWVCRFTPPMGDDVLFQFTTSMTYYLDDTPLVLGQKITTLPLLLQSLSHRYLHWTGRMVGYTLLTMLTWAGETFTAVFQAAVFTALLWVCAVLVTGSRAAALRSPEVLLAGFFVLIYYAVNTDFLFLITFTSIYTVSIVLYFWYFLVQQRTLGRLRKTPPAVLLGVNLLGLVCGLTNEMFGLTCCLILGLRLLDAWLLQHRLTLPRILAHNAGLLAGLCVCCLAPGNFMRSRQSHDSGIGASYAQKLAASFAAHRQAFCLRAGAGFALQCVLLILCAAALLVLARSGGLAAWARRTFPLLLAVAVSPFLWAVMAYVPYYGLSLWCALVFVAEGQCIAAAVRAFLGVETPAGGELPGAGTSAAAGRRQAQTEPPAAGRGSAVGPATAEKGAPDGLDPNVRHAGASAADALRAAVSDAAAAGAGVPDAGTPDAGAPDAGALDVGAPGAGVPDAGALGTAGARGSQKETSSAAARSPVRRPFVFACPLAPHRPALLAVSGVVCALAMAVCLAANSGWLRDLAGVTLQREMLISSARAHGDAFVAVPRYPESTNRIFTNYNYCNGDEYAESYYVEWYGTKVLVQPQ